MTIPYRACVHRPPSGSRKLCKKTSPRQCHQCRGRSGPSTPVHPISATATTVPSTIRGLSPFLPPPSRCGTNERKWNAFRVQIDSGTRPHLARSPREENECCSTGSCHEIIALPGPCVCGSRRRMTNDLPAVPQPRQRRANGSAHLGTSLARRVQSLNPLFSQQTDLNAMR